ncbi:MAG: MBL fold metallo-hydrolase [candidate division Zixibacteria bacterium]|nr:MBL fold metallo-hydrolase [candidate division Zixibacteria bacterium]
MKISTLELGPFAVNCYLYWNDRTAEGLIIDPGAEPEVIIGAIAEAGFTPRAILLTHGHADHFAALADIKGRFQVPVYVGKGEQDVLANPSANVSALVGRPIVAPVPDHLVVDEELIEPAGITLRVLMTPGHSPAGVCYLDETQGLLFCGDTLFYGSVGRTDLPGGSFRRLLESIEEKILKLPDAIVCYPGHGPRTTVGAERNDNPFLTGRYFV